MEILFRLCRIICS